MKIRIATPDDIPQLLELDRVSETAAHWTSRQYRDLFEAGPSMLILAAVAEERDLLGFLVARCVGTEWELENISVAANRRRRGIGKNLVQNLVEAARQANGEAIFLEVRRSNQAARRFYEDVGFRQTGVRKEYYAAPAEDAILYSMNLN